MKPRNGEINMEENGSRNSGIKAKIVTEPAVREVTDLTVFKDKAGHYQMRIILDNKADQAFSLPFKEAEIIGTKHFDRVEDTRKLVSLEFMSEKGMTVVSKEEIPETLNLIGPGKEVKITIENDTGTHFRCTAWTYSINGNSVKKGNAFIWAISEYLGLKIKTIVEGAGFRKAIVDEDDIEVSPKAIEELYNVCRAKGTVPRIVCSQTLEVKETPAGTFNNFSIVGIGKA